MHRPVFLYACLARLVFLAELIEDELKGSIYSAQSVQPQFSARLLGARYAKWKQVSGSARQGMKALTMLSMRRVIRTLRKAIKLFNTKVCHFQRRERSCEAEASISGYPSSKGERKGEKEARLTDDVFLVVVEVKQPERASATMLALCWVMSRHMKLHMRARAFTADGDSMAHLHPTPRYKHVTTHPSLPRDVVVSSGE